MSSPGPGVRRPHHNYVVALLSDLFGIQSRGGCSCAGPYGHRLLRIGLDQARGVVVLAAVEGGPAAKAGLRPGDVIVRMDDATVDTVEDLFGELRQRRPGSQVRLTFIRDGREQQATVTLADRPAEG